MNTIVLRRRLFYICAMVLLLVPLYFLGNPSVREPNGSVKSAGGTLAQLRTAYNLGQGDLGEIDPASESMRLATLGLRGVAATILWQKAEYYKKEQYWDRLAATLNQIAVLQPHFIKVWEFQSHNLSYNVSAEFDNYRHRYQWVKRGMDYLVKGSKYNKQRTELPFELGWFFGNKMGVADEKAQFRELYKDDSNFHAEMLTKADMDLTQQDGLGPDRKPDNWLGGRLWYERSYDMVKEGARPARSAMMFYRMGPQWLMKYSEGIQGDGVLDDAARYAWRTAGRDWKTFGERQILTSFGDTIYLTELEKANQEYTDALLEFQEFCGETYQKLLDEKKLKLDADELAAYEKSYIDRDFQEVMRAERAARGLEIPPIAVAKVTPDAIRIEALQKAKDLQAKRDKIQHIEIYRNQINYGYWAQRCIAEQEDAALAARTNMYDANLLLEKGELDAALTKYETAWTSWEELFNKHPAMMIDDAAEDVMASIERYRRLLDTSELPEDFGLAKFMEFREIYDDTLADPAMMGVIAEWPLAYPGRNFLDEMLQKSYDAIEMEKEMKAIRIDVATPLEGSAPRPTPAASLDSEAAAEEPAAAMRADPGSSPEPAEDVPGEESSSPEETEKEASKASVDEPVSVEEPVSGDKSGIEAQLEVAKPLSGNAPSPKSGGN